jgi:uncharacterized protein (TIGR02452 family)
MERPFRAAVITAPAPHSGPILREDPDAGPAIAETFRRRWGHVLAIARDRGHRTVILGAWGCGAFEGDPTVVAETARERLNDGHFGGSFDRVVFAIPSFGERSARNLAAFRELFG